MHKAVTMHDCSAMCITVVILLGGYLFTWYDICMDNLKNHELIKKNY